MLLRRCATQWVTLLVLCVSQWGCATDAEEFTCADGSTIETARTCDGELDCTAGDDETIDLCGTPSTLKKLELISVGLSNAPEEGVYYLTHPIEVTLGFDLEGSLLDALD